VFSSLAVYAAALQLMFSRCRVLSVVSAQHQDTALHDACYYGFLEFARFLVNDCKADPTVEDKVLAELLLVVCCMCWHVLSAERISCVAC
jgi:hypothetical protein